MKETLFRFLLLTPLFIVSSAAFTTFAQDRDTTKEYENSILRTVSVLDYGAVGDGITDNTTAFQNALNAIGPDGGIVNVPQGQYLFKGCIRIPKSVTLRGPWNSVTAHNGCRDKGLPKPTDDGATLLVTGNAGNEDAEAFISLDTNSVLQGVVLYWPEQKEDDVPTPYPWAIQMRGKNPAVLDVELLNPYKGIDASNNERALIRNIHGQPLSCGIFVDRIYDIGRIENVHFNPWWSMKPKLFQWQLTHGKAFIFKRTDWHYVLNTFCFGYAVGYEFGGSDDGICNGNFLGIGADYCHTAVLIEQSAPMGILITNGEFVAMNGDNPTQIVVAPTNFGSVRFCNCSFWGPCEQIARIAGIGTIGFSDCEFHQWDRNNKGNAAIQVTGGSVLIRGCNFQEDKNQISVEQSAERVIITDNFVKGKIRIDSKCQSAHIDGNIGNE